MTEPRNTEEIYKEIQDLRERREAVLHENYDCAAGEQRLVELRSFFDSQQSVLDCLRARLLSQLREELGCDSPSEETVRHAYEQLQQRVAARPTAAAMRAAAAKVAQMQTLANALVLFAKVSAIKPPAPCVHTAGAACARCLAAAEAAAAALAAACESMGAATLASLPPAAQQQVFATVTALRDAAYAVARRALTAAHWPHVAAPGTTTTAAAAGEAAEAGETETSPETFARTLELCTACQALYRRWCPAAAAPVPVPQAKTTATSDNGSVLQESCMDVVRDLVVAPVTERFVYHFCGSKATAAMPCLRWALQFITDTLRRVAPFVQAAVQPAVARVCPGTRVLREIGAALVALAAHKIVAAVNAFAPDADYATRDALVIHCANELVAYETAVRRAPALRALGLPSLAGAVFAAPDARQHDGSTLLDRWVRAEWALACHALDAQLKQKSTSSTTSATGTTGSSTPGTATGLGPCWDTDPASEYGAPAVAESVVDLAFSVGERFALLPTAAAREAFVTQFQIPLFQRFLHELTAAEPRGTRAETLAGRCALARACLYCEDTLWEWLQEVLPETARAEAVAAAASALAGSYAVLRKDTLARTVALALDPFCSTVTRLFTSTSHYGTVTPVAGAGGATAEKAGAGHSAGPIVTDVSEQTAFALDTLLPCVQQCVDALQQLRVGGTVLCEQFLTAVCTKTAGTYVAGLTTRPAERTLAPTAVAQLCADADAVRAALAVFDAPLAARHLAPLADCCTFLRTGHVPPDSPLPPTARADLALLHIVE